MTAEITIKLQLQLKKWSITIQFWVDYLESLHLMTISVQMFLW